MRRGAVLGGLALLAVPLVLAGCVERIAESRVRSALVGAGLSEPTSACMARRMVDRLTIAQLRKLQALQGPKRSLADYVAAVRRVGDPAVIEVTASSAALCATGFG
ncbi:hypothetical protein ACFOON_15575 [Novosphingobium piscinae]|uniref:Lipoprotein n=1 Tax=Novosphingobium piscinae TaxID=1507448 RepID=A0A7X1FX99_9SPHN|nr:hypothetical protein [Novosphingobium piscinae]MBC2668680.1 hypothetical protein [Novosphingobium piscinae]